MPSCPTTPTGYAPWGLDLDPEPLGLVPLVVTTAVGPVLVHHDPRPSGRSGRRATVLLHGAAGSWTTWTPLLRAARESGAPLARPVLVDLPGWGGSPAPVAPLALDDAVDVVVRVAEELGATELEVVGHSLGGSVALQLAATRPDLVTGAGVVSGTTFAALDAVRHPWRGLRRLPAFTLLRAAFAVVPDAAPVLLGAATRVGLLRALSAPVFRHVRSVDRSVLEAFVAEIRPRAFLDAARSGRDLDTHGWGRTEAPVVAVSGADDAFARHDDLDRLVATVPRAHAVLLPDCGHFAHVERPEETLAALRAGGVAGATRAS
ncbi:alpha/beta fold hydrolase [Frigoribacterium salinisoli]